MLISSPARMPRLDSEAPVVRLAVPVPVAGVGAELEDEPEDVAALELLEPAEADDAAALPVDVELPDGCSALCTAATSWELTRLSAVPLAMLERPFDRVVSALAMALISVFSAVADWFCAWA